VIDRTNPRFWECFAKLPPDVQRLARQKHRLWLENPFHPSLCFKELTLGLWSARITSQHRALALRRADLVLWIWIGPHAEYDRLIQD
jgi:hypothetical protein